MNQWLVRVLYWGRLVEVLAREILALKEVFFKEEAELYHGIAENAKSQVTYWPPGRFLESV